MSLDQQDLDSIAQSLGKNIDNVAIVVSDNFDSLKERADATEFLLYRQLVALSAKIETVSKDVNALRELLTD